MWTPVGSLLSGSPTTSTPAPIPVLFGYIHSQGQGTLSLFCPVPLRQAPRTSLHRDAMTSSPSSPLPGPLGLGRSDVCLLPQPPSGKQLKIHGQKMPSAMFLAEQIEFSESLWKKALIVRTARTAPGALSPSNRPLPTLAGRSHISNCHGGVEKTTFSNAFCFSYLFFFWVYFLSVFLPAVLFPSFIVAFVFKELRFSHSFRVDLLVKKSLYFPWPENALVSLRGYSH